MRVCYFGTYRHTYVRNRLMIDRLRARGIEVVECHQRLWQGLEDRQQAAGGGWRSPRFLWRVMRTYLLLLWRYRQVGDYDVMLVGYPGQLDVLLARVLSWLRRKPLVWDVFMSIYLIALERHLDQKSPFTIRMINRLEGIALRLPDWLIIDTEVYLEWFQHTYGIHSERVLLVPLGADDRIFYPRAKQQIKADGKFRCIYYGTYIPNHGVRYILEAAHLLTSEPKIQFELVGTGPQHQEMLALAKSLDLQNVDFSDWMPVEELVQRVAEVDVCLGTFGITPQALLTMQHKIHEGLAMAKPIINGESPMMSRTLVNGEHILLCERENAPALADAIRLVYHDPILREKIARQGHEFFIQNLSMEKISALLEDHLQTVLEGKTTRKKAG